MIALCYGTRPQVIKSSVLRPALEQVGPVYSIDTGQHYDATMSALLYDQLGAAPPDRFLEVGSGSHAEQTALILTRAESALRECAPRLVVSIGDTNSTLGVCLAAAKLRVPIVHVEAGLRTGDRQMAEELNRRCVDALAALLCTPSASATLRMRSEHPDAAVRETGDVALDVLLKVQGRLPEPQAVVPGLPPSYLFATLHRAELTDDPGTLAAVLRALAATGTAGVIALHPRTALALQAMGIVHDRIGLLRLIPAVGYLETVALIAGARVVVTDSGGVQREAYWLGTPCVTLRSETEWEETVACEANRLISPLDAARGLADAITAQVGRWNGESRWPRSAYGNGQAAEKVAAAVAEMLA